MNEFLDAVLDRKFRQVESLERKSRSLWTALIRRPWDEVLAEEYFEAQRRLAEARRALTQITQSLMVVF